MIALLITTTRGILMDSREFGSLNDHAVGIIMKELVRRAIIAIRNKRLTFEVTEKHGVGEKRDILTSADLAAQAIYLKSLRECFPGFGIVAEEEGFRVESQVNGNASFSVDPLDGTKAFERRQSYGIGTQIALSYDDKIISAWVGDVMTQEIYGFRPGSKKVHRISDYEIPEALTVKQDLPLSEQYLLMRNNPHKFSSNARILGLQFDPILKKPLFKDIDVEGGSIGLSFARLWKGEVGGILMRPHKNTPWDLWPVVGISHKMGFVFLEKPEEKRCFRIYQPAIKSETEFHHQETLVIHESRLEELKAWQS